MATNPEEIRSAASILKQARREHDAYSGADAELENKQSKISNLDAVIKTKSSELAELFSKVS